MKKFKIKYNYRRIVKVITRAYGKCRMKHDLHIEDTKDDSSCRNTKIKNFYIILHKNIKKMGVVPQMFKCGHKASYN